MSVRLTGRLRRPVGILLLGAWAIGWTFSVSVAAGNAQPAAPDATTAAASGETFWERMKDTLNPSQVCPHCGKEFSETRSLWMLLVGFVGQFFFTSRFLVQWIASEKRKESYIPLAFWYLSIVGSLMLLAYAISIRAWPVILGQMFGVVVYGRNLALIARSRNRAASENDSPGGGGPSNS